MRDPFSVHDEFYGDLDCHRGERRHALRLKVLETGRNVCFGGKGGGSAPSPDPMIGEAAMKNAQVGEDWLSFARQQFDSGNIRQEELDALSERIIGQQMESNELANQWASEDRQIQEDYRNKYDGWADEDRTTGQQYRDDFAGIGKQALEAGNQYRGIFDAEAENQYQFAREQQDRYRKTYQPMEERFAKDAAGWDSAERQAKMASEARADVLSSAAGAQQQQQRQMASMGIDPRSGRYASANSELGLQTALSAAGAQNMARDNVRTQGMALRGTAIDMGRGVQSMGQQATQLGMQATGAGHSAYNTGVQTNLQANNLGLAASGVGNTSASLGMGNQGAGYQGLGLGVNAGSAAMGNALGAEGNWQNNNSIMEKGFGGAMQGYNNQGNIAQNQYNGQVQAWSAQQQASSANSAGLMGGIGTIAGAGIMAF